MCPFSDFKKKQSRDGIFLKFFFGKMDLPLPWFCSSFWKVKICKKSDNFLIGKSASIAMIFIWACSSSSGEHGGVSFISGGWLERSQDGFEVGGRIILVSMVTNHSYQTHPISIEPTPPCRALCEEHSGVMFIVGG